MFCEIWNYTNPKLKTNSTNGKHSYKNEIKILANPESGFQQKLKVVTLSFKN